MSVVTHLIHGTLVAFGGVVLELSIPLVLWSDTDLWKLRASTLRALTSGRVGPGHPVYLLALDLLDHLEGELLERGFRFERSKTF